MFLVFLTIGVAFWKGGDPFRAIGQGITEVGNVISKFGDLVDDVKIGGKKVQKTYDQLKETISKTDLSPKRKN
jgi:hypothetical protein